MARKDEAKGSSEPPESEFLLPFERQTLKGDYRGYLNIKRNNFFATIQQFRGIWDCFGLLDETWIREFADLERQRDPNQMLPLLLFINAHAQFRTAFELAFRAVFVMPGTCFAAEWSRWLTLAKSSANRSSRS